MDWKPGEDEEWLRENLPSFKELADGGHKGFQSVLEELNAVKAK
jgi:hypothetical protein